MKSINKIKILLLVDFSADTYWWTAFKNMFLAELAASQYEIEIFDSLGLDLFDLNLRLINKIASGGYYFFLTGTNHKTLFPSTLQEINFFTKSVLFTTDNALIPHQHALIVKYFSLVWLLDNQNISLFKKWGANYIHLPWAGNSFLALDATSYTNQIPRVLFIGTPHGSRIKQINILLDHKIPVSIYSDKIRESILPSKNKFLFSLIDVFQHLTVKTGRKILLGKILSLFYNSKLLENDYLEVFPSVKFERMPYLYKKYRLSWSSVYARNTGYLNSPLITINARSFEIPMSGGLQFVVKNDELDKYFSDGHDIVFYDKENFVEIARQYLFELSEEKIVQMKKNAQRNTLMNHTWENRFKKIFDILDI